MELRDVKAELPSYKTDGTENSSGHNGLDSQKKDIDIERTQKHEQNGKIQPSKGILNAHHISGCIKRNKRGFMIGFKAFLLLGYFVYFGFAVAHHKNDEPSWRLIVSTVFGVLLISWSCFKARPEYVCFQKYLDSLSQKYSSGKRRLVIRW